MNYLKFIFLISLIYIVFIGWSSNTWLMIWFMMEVSFMVFIGFSMIDVNYSITESLMKYFITQVFISLMFFVLMVFFLFNLVCYINFCLAFVLFMKLGMFPFHIWVIGILGKLSWISFFILLTLMKFLPILLFYYLNGLTNFDFMLILSVLAGSVLGLGNLLIQKLMGYSSLIHLCWLFLCLNISLSFFFIYFLGYIFTMVVLIYVLSYKNIFYINQFKMFSNSLFAKLFIFFLILSMAGFPPFLGFVIKWMVLNFIIYLNMKILFFSLLFFSLFSVIFYLELFYYLMMLESIGVLWYNSFFLFFNKLLFLVLFFYLSVYFII